MGPFWRILVLAVLAGCSPAERDRPGGLADSAAETSSPPEGAAATIKPIGPWSRLERDNLHDPTNPALALLQQPEEALSVLPRGEEGNFVDWAAALRSGAINPRTNIYPETKITVLDLDVLMEDTSGMPMVLFPHRPHTEWLDCANCHDKIFKKEKGSNDINMLSVLQGHHCGQCHGAVSFPLTQCARCHSVDRKSASTRAQP